MYVVVFKTRVGVSEGAITWSVFRDKEHFDNWYKEKMRSWYEVVEQGITEKRALELCSSPEAKLAVFSSSMREIEFVLKQI